MSNGRRIHEIAFGPFNFQDAVFSVHAKKMHKLKQKYLVCISITSFDYYPYSMWVTQSEFFCFSRLFSFESNFISRHNQTINRSTSYNGNSNINSSLHEILTPSIRFNSRCSEYKYINQ